MFGATTRWYGRQLDRSLDYRPITALFAVTILGLVGFLYMNTSKELAPEEDQGIVFSVLKAPKYANIDYPDFYSEKLDKAFAAFPETDLRFVINGINGAQQRHRRHAAEAVGRARAFLDQAEAAGAGRALQDRRRQRVRLQPAAAARRSGRPADPDGDQLHQRLPGDL